MAGTSLRTLQNLSTYWQHIQTFGQLSCEKSPCEGIFKDVAVAIHCWQEEGDNVIVISDFSEDVQFPFIWHYFVVEAHMTIHRNSGPALLGALPYRGHLHVSSINSPLLEQLFVF